MSLLVWREFRAFTVLACIVTFTTFLFSYTLRDSSLHFNYAIYKSGSFFSNGQCGCRQCMTELEDDPWFTERFNHSVHPLMSRRNSLLTNDTYHWWQRLQGEQDPANFSEVVEKLFQIIPDDDDDLYMDAGPERCRTCAVVGNSGNLNKSHYGPLIDSSDVIIRMNMAPTSGFEEDVGSRTTHHVMYPESAMDLDNTTSLLLIPFKTLDLQWITSALTTGSIKQTYVPVPSRIKANKNKVLILNPTFFKYVYNTWLESNGRYPSTGFLSLLFAVHICDKVNVFGFGADRYGNWHHYWEKNQHGGAFRKTGVHDADYEYNVTLLLADKHKINIFKGF